MRTAPSTSEQIALIMDGLTKDGCVLSLSRNVAKRQHVRTRCGRICVVRACSCIACGGDVCTNAKGILGVPRNMCLVLGLSINLASAIILHSPLL